MRYPLPLTGTALQVFQLAAVRGLGQESDVAICRVWDGTGGRVFPGGMSGGGGCGDAQGGPN
jgi:3-hydroxyisobutyrate dehydrogenase